MHYVPATFRIPHARWNEVQEEAIASCGYSVLTKSAEAGVDCFVKQQKKSLFVHFQGHPEYETQSLLGEYRRDMGRFLRGENEVCPTIPRGYFGTKAEEILTAFRRKALSDRCPEFFADFPADHLAKEFEKRLASAGQAHLPQLAAVHGVAAWPTTLKAAGPNGRSRTRRGSDRGGDRAFGHHG